jgi:hypothetical protein
MAFHAKLNELTTNRRNEMKVLLKFVMELEALAAAMAKHPDSEAELDFICDEPDAKKEEDSNVKAINGKK